MKIQVLTEKGPLYIRGLGKRVRNPNKRKKSDDKPDFVSMPPLLTPIIKDAHEYEHLYQAQLERDDVLEFHPKAFITP